MSESWWRALVREEVRWERCEQQERSFTTLADHLVTGDGCPRVTEARPAGVRSCAANTHTHRRVWTTGLGAVKQIHVNSFASERRTAAASLAVGDAVHAVETPVSVSAVPLSPFLNLGDIPTVFPSVNEHTGDYQSTFTPRIHARAIKQRSERTHSPTHPHKHTHTQMHTPQQPSSQRSSNV